MARSSCSGETVCAAADKFPAGPIVIADTPAKYVAIRTTDTRKGVAQAAGTEYRYKG